jgi:hypothetical protein
MHLLANFNSTSARQMPTLRPFSNDFLTARFPRRKKSDSDFSAISSFDWVRLFFSGKNYSGPEVRIFLAENISEKKGSSGGFWRGVNLLAAKDRI